MKKHSIFLVLILFSLFIAGCKYDYILPVPTPVIDNGGNPISFSSQIVPIFSNGDQCTKCHKPGGAVSPDFTKPAATLYSLIFPTYVNTADPAGSTIYKNAYSGNHNGARVSDTEAALILQWIKEGANNN